MGSSIPSEISMDCIIYLALKASSISEFMAEVKMIHSATERIAKLNDYVDRLDAEMEKIEVFKRELPLCMRLLGDAIWIVKKELNECKNLNTMPVLEEFIPLKKSTDEKYGNVKSSKEEEFSNIDKMNWMSSVRLWNSDNQHPNNIQNFKLEMNLGGLKQETNQPDVKQDMYDVVGGGKNSWGNAFLPYEECTPLTVTKVEKKETEIDCRDFSSKSTSSNDCLRLRADQPSEHVYRKQRRCWSPELHRLFVDALSQLGGAQAAKPKQIRELMRVDDLSNDEVKSHLQKYRIHNRRVSSAMNAQPVFGGLWMLQDHRDKSPMQKASRSGSSGGDKSEVEDYEKSDTHCWKYQIKLSTKQSA